MIEHPRRSVTRFFIPLIDVMMLLFCIFLLMPIVKATGDKSGEETGVEERLLESERRELDRLRRDQRAGEDRDQLQQDVEKLERQVRELRQEKVDVLNRRLAIRVLEIGDEGKLFYYDPKREQERRQEITRENVQQFIDRQRLQASGDELYFLILYPRPAAGNPVFPLRSQREEFERWFERVAHGYDIPVRSR